MGYQTHSLLIVPVKNHENEIMGVLELINAHHRVTREVLPFSEEDQRLLQTLSSQAAVALSKNKLIEDFKALFDSLIELIATAIDEKSPYTGDHCRRVPELTTMLAEAVCNKKEGAFKDFTLSEEQMYELKVAALLHDCGKVTTPVHIVDKATRLETIFDRIHLIDTRFDLLRRDAEIAFFQSQMADLLKAAGEDLSVPKDIREQASEREGLAARLEQIERDRNLLRACNKGDTVMTEDLQERIKDIALRYKWVSADHKQEPVIADDELYSLTSAQGTLTPAERAVINQHVETTIKMLEALHYPKSLRNVPLFAQAHHEHMDGTGYPKGLTREQIPLQGRIIAIADIFEALTARNRPYKKERTLMEALRVLGSMKLEGQIDPDLFDVFINEKVYLRYAEKFLSHSQIDNVVLSQIPGYVSPSR
jgi:HD-GYP domain-containing protein (c-di-GMP phosphodiesterase class II)